MSQWRQRVFLLIVKPTERRGAWPSVSAADYAHVPTALVSRPTNTANRETKFWSTSSVATCCLHSLTYKHNIFAGAKNFPLNLFTCRGENVPQLLNCVKGSERTMFILVFQCISESVALSDSGCLDWPLGSVG